MNNYKLQYASEAGGRLDLTGDGQVGVQIAIQGVAVSSMPDVRAEKAGSVDRCGAGSVLGPTGIIDAWRRGEHAVGTDRP